MTNRNRSGRRAGGEFDLGAMAQFLGLTPPAGVQEKRSVPRGRLRPAFWNAQFDTVAELLEGWGYDVEVAPGEEDRIELGEGRSIHINSSAHPETRFYTLLHEAGHAHIRRRWKAWSAAHPRYLEHPDRGVSSQRRRSKAFRVGLVAEEIEAWNQGLQLARRLGLFVDPVKFDTDKNNALLTYISWAAGSAPASRRRKGG